jgi:hypothetical protein
MYVMCCNDTGASGFRWTDGWHDSSDAQVLPEKGASSEVFGQRGVIEVGESRKQYLEWECY